MRVGGQAVVEGVLMIGKRAVMAVRRQDGGIVLEEVGVPRRGKLSKIPLLRGIYNLYYSLSLGIKALNRSVEIVSKEEMKKSQKLGSILLAVVLAIGLFFVLPMFLTNLLKPLRDNEALFSLVEGSLRIAIFLLYVWIISLAEDVKRLFQYHGAEHMTIHAFEAGDELTVENVKKYKTLHPRCGTNYVMIFPSSIKQFKVNFSVPPNTSVAEYKAYFVATSSLGTVKVPFTFRILPSQEERARINETIEALQENVTKIGDVLDEGRRLYSMGFLW